MHRLGYCYYVAHGNAPAAACASPRKPVDAWCVSEVSRLSACIEGCSTWNTGSTWNIPRTNPSGSIQSPPCLAPFQYRGLVPGFWCTGVTGFRGHCSCLSQPSPTALCALTRCPVQTPGWVTLRCRACSLVGLLELLYLSSSQRLTLCPSNTLPGKLLPLGGHPMTD